MISLVAMLCILPRLSLAGMVSVSGHVTDHLTGEAVAGVRVGISYLSSPFGTTEVGAATTATDGTYAWTGMCNGWADGRCYLDIQDSRYIPANASFDDTETDVTVDFVLIRPATITGSLTVAGGLSTANIGVSVEYFSDTGQRWVSPGGTYQQEGGDYVIGGLPPDLFYRLCAGGMETGTVRQCYDHHDQSPLAQDPVYDAVVVGEGDRRDGIDFDLGTGGSFGGTIYDGYLGVPRDRGWAQFSIYDENGAYLQTVEMNIGADGSYRIQGLPDGSFYLTAWVSGSFQDADQIYPGIVCPDDGCPPVTVGQALTISGASVLSGLDFTVHPNVVISGYVTDATSGAAVGGVDIFTSVSPWSVPSATSEAGTGHFMFYIDDTDAPFYVFTRGAQPHIDQVYPAIACIQNSCVNQGQAFKPQRGDVLNDVNFELQPGAAVAGQTYDALTGLPMGAYIYLYDADFNIVWSGNSYGTEPYMSAAWFPGTYYVLAAGFGYLTGCAFYDSRPCPAVDQDPSAVAPTPIVIGAGEIRTGIDFHLLADELFGNGFEF